MGDNAETTLPCPGENIEVPQQVIAMNLFHLFLVIQMLARAEEGCPYPNMTLFIGCLHSLTNIGLILDSGFLFKYAARYLVTCKNVLRFAKTILKAFPGKTNYEWSASLIAEAFGNIARMKLALFHYLGTFHSNPPQYQALARKVCRSLGSNNSRFWNNQQIFIRCTFCHKAISRADSILRVRANVQVISCCYCLALYICFQCFLLLSVACDHDCSNVLSCVMLARPLRMRKFNFTVCPACEASYVKGRCFSNDKLNAIVVAKRE